MSECRGKSENNFDRGAIPLEGNPQGRRQISSVFHGAGSIEAVPYVAAHLPRGQQPARFQCSQILTGNGQRQLQPRGHAGNSQLR